MKKSINNKRMRIKLWLRLLTLVIIISTPNDLPVSTRIATPDWYRRAQNHYAPLHRLQELGHSIGPSILLASASYLDQIGPMSQIMNEFVNSLLEKISFLAEIIIESSLAEQCDILDCQLANNNNSNNLVNDLNWSVDKNLFDEREYTNVDLFIKSFNGNMASAKQNGCKLFCLDIERRDLPVGDMEVCCGSFHSCYNKCGNKKLDCDLEFRQCLSSICKQKYDYTNVKVLRKYHQLNRRHAPLFADEPLADDVEGEGGWEEEPEVVKEKEMNNYVNELDEDELYGSINRDKSNQNDKREALQGGEFDRYTTKSLKDKYKACKLATKVLIIGNLAFGCQAYKQSQQRACCLNKIAQKNTTDKGNNSNNNNKGNGAPSWQR